MKRVLGHPTARPGTTDCASGVRAEPRNWYAAVSGSWYCFVPALVVSVRGTHDARRHVCSSLSSSAYFVSEFCI